MKNKNCKKFPKIEKQNRKKIKFERKLKIEKQNRKKLKF